jgi:hypothetical protein
MAGAIIAGEITATARLNLPITIVTKRLQAQTLAAQLTLGQTLSVKTDKSYIFNMQSAYSLRFKPGLGAFRDVNE